MPVRSSQLLWRMPTVVDHPTHLIICHHQGGRKGVQVESQGAGVGGREGGRGLSSVTVQTICTDSECRRPIVCVFAFPSAAPHCC